MCRQGIISLDRKDDVSVYLATVASAYSTTQRDGFGFSYYNEDSHSIVTHKTKMAARRWILENQPHIETNALIFHTRTATGGGVNDLASHPFQSKSISLSHNGVLQNYDKMKKYLEEEKGAKFKTTVDSEIILHAYKTFGWKFIDVFNEFGVTGYMALQILEYPNKISVYRTSFAEYGLAKLNGGYLGASDSTIIPVKRIEPDTVYHILDGELLNKEKVAEFSGYGGTKYRWSGNYGVSSSVVDDYYDDYESRKIKNSQVAYQSAQKYYDSMNKTTVYAKARKENGYIGTIMRGRIEYDMFEDNAGKIRYIEVGSKNEPDKDWEDYAD